MAEQFDEQFDQAWDEWIGKSKHSFQGEDEAFEAFILRLLKAAFKAKWPEGRANQFNEEDEE